MNKRSQFLQEREYNANRIAALALFAGLIIFLLFYVSAVLKNINHESRMYSLIVLAFCTGIIPNILVFLKYNHPCVKYITMASNLVVMATIYLNIAKDSILLLWLYPVALSCFYYNKKFTAISIATTAPILFGCMYFILQREYAISGILPDGASSAVNAFFNEAQVMLVVLVWFGTMFYGQSMGADKVVDSWTTSEEKASLTNKVIDMANKSASVSEILTGSVKELSSITSETIASSEQIAKNTENVSDSFNETIKYINTASQTIADISKNLKEIAAQSASIAAASEQANKETTASESMIKEAILEMQEMEETVQKSTESIAYLGELTNKIGNITDVIGNIAGQTNLLSLNASIESARAGEHGKGFSVVAGEIKNLAQRSADSTREISKLIQQIIDNAQAAIAHMESNAKKVGEGKKMIERVGDSFASAAKAEKVVYNDIRKITDSSGQIDKYANNMIDIITNIKDQSEHGLLELHNIAIASSNQVGSLGKVSESVFKVDTVSQELAKISSEIR